MTTYSEKQLIKRLALYRGDYHQSLGLEDMIEDAERIFADGSDYGPLAGLDKVADGLVIECMSNFGLGMMERHETDGILLDLSQRCRFFSFVVEKKFFDEDPNFVTPALSPYGEWMLQFIATGRTDLQQRLEAIVLSVVKSGRYASPAGTTGYFTAPSKLGVFALEMLAAGRGETINWESFHIPPDPFWLDCARIGLIEPDPVRAADWARRLCDAHMKTLQTDKDNFVFNASTGHEIELEAHFLWPIAVHAFLRLRGQLGLETGEIDHRLMQTPFALLRDWNMPAGSWQAEPWYSDILARTLAEAPSLQADLDLIR